MEKGVVLVHDGFERSPVIHIVVANLQISAARTIAS